MKYFSIDKSLYSKEEYKAWGKKHPPEKADA
jgi:hypothetical protein